MRAEEGKKRVKCSKKWQETAFFAYFLSSFPAKHEDRFLEICIDEESAFCFWSRCGHVAPVRCYRHGSEGLIQAGIQLQGFSDSWEPVDAPHRRSRYLDYLSSSPYGGAELKVPER